jgi:hypothetical protein
MGEPPRIGTILTGDVDILRCTMMFEQDHKTGDETRRAS